MQSIQKHRKSQPVYSIPLSTTMNINLLGISNDKHNNTNTQYNSNISTVQVSHSPPPPPPVLDNAQRRYVKSLPKLAELKRSDSLTVVSVKSSNDATSMSISSSGSSSSLGTPSPAVIYVSSPPPLPCSNKGQHAGGLAYETDSTVGTSLAEDTRSYASVFSELSTNTETSEDSSTDVSATEGFVTASPRVVRVALMSRQDLTVMVKVSCRTEVAAQDQRLLTMLEQITSICMDDLQNSGQKQVNLTTPHISKLRLNDKQPVREHVAALSRDLNDDVIICEAIGRKSTMDDIVGTSIHDIVHSDNKCIIGQSGVVVRLRRKNKFAPLQEFIDQLCYHIHVAKPTSIGTSGKLKLGRRPPQRHDRAVTGKLLSQPFAYDLIITVAEAARRSFVEIEEFALYA